MFVVECLVFCTRRESGQGRLELLGRKLGYSGVSRGQNSNNQTLLKWEISKGGITVRAGHKLAARYDTRDKQLIMTRGASVNLPVEFGRPMVLTPICGRIPGLQYDSYENMSCRLQHLSIREICIAASHHHPKF